LFFLREKTMNVIESNASILLVDDTPDSLDVLVEHLENAGFEVAVALSGENAFKVIDKFIPDLILLDVKLSGIDGFETCFRLKQQAATQDVPVIFITGLTETVDKVKGFSVGGVDYITKPFQCEEVLMRVNTHITLRRQQQKLAQQNEQLKQEIQRREHAEDALQTADAKLSALSQIEAERWGISTFIGQSQTIITILNEIRRLQDVEKTNVLILGESGTGKELVARAIHFGGVRKKKPFVPVNCSAIPDDLADSAFFGHVRGAFTGASSNRKGYFELAQGGTLFLDEIGDMPLRLQAKLLRILEDGFVTPVGSEQPKRVDVRVIAATNADLSAQIEAKMFRQDFYFRLSGYVITLPPLRVRQEDIALLAQHFLSLFAKEMGYPGRTLAPDVLTALKNYHFPGNVRELKNIIERALLKSDGSPIQVEHLQFLEAKSATQKIQKIVTIAEEELPSADENKILGYVRQQGSINNTQCRQLLAVDYNRASYLLRKMSHEGVLVREGKQRWAVYRLANDFELKEYN
jgi:DNA-binding NtrC family response regulator